MNKHKPWWWLAVFALGIVTGAALAQPVRELVPGRDYDLIQPAQPTANPAKVEVIELFSYACPHCYHLEPILGKWLQALPSDVDFKRLPLSAGPAWYPTAKLFFALDAMGIEGKLHSDIFNAIHGDRSLNPNDEGAIAEWIGRRGVDSGKFNIAYGFSGPRLQQTQRSFAAYGVSGVPTFIVDGKYRVRNEAAKNYDDLMALTEAVIAKARTEHGPAKAGGKSRK